MKKIIFLFLSSPNRRLELLKLKQLIPFGTKVRMEL